MNSTAVVSPNERLPALDLLRFTAAVAVMLYHYVSSYPSAEDASQPGLIALSAVTRYGYLGVELFFMISGFVILWSSFGRGPTAFVISRISRLYPSYWVGMAFTMLCILLLADAVPSVGVVELTPRTIAANATMLPAVFNAPLIEGVYWTLEIEIRFYALIFLLLIVRQLPRVELWLWIWLAVCTITLFHDTPWIVEYLALDPYGPFFIAGCFFYLIFSDRATSGRVVALVLCALICALESRSHRSDFISPDRISGFVVPGLTIAFFGVFGLITTIKSGLWIRASVARQLGELTYPLYLTHATMGMLVYELLRPKTGIAAALIVILILALLVAWVISTTVDIPARKPFTALLQRLAYTFCRLGWPRLPTEDSTTKR